MEDYLIRVKEFIEKLQASGLYHGSELQDLKDAVFEIEGHRDNTNFIRDNFAEAALQGMLANQTYDPPRRRKTNHFATDAYDFADAMLKARG